uniref:Ig-like domain-containing protein n=1 Tax=Naja naja TaxID=35670 RepID=A0A8C6XG04_NAJNA
MAGSWASFLCSANDFSSKAIKVLWSKDGETIQHNKTRITSSEVKGRRVYRVESKVAILLVPGDLRSQLSCQIQHNSSQKAQRNFPLGDVLRVPSKMHLETIPPSPVQLNASVMVICNAESFYPENASIGLFAKDDPSGKGMVAPKILNPDGTFSYKSFMEVRATEERNSSVFLCQVKQYSQLLVNKTTRLFITRPLKRSENSQQQSIIVLCIMLFLIKVAILLFIFCLFLINVCRHHRTRSHSGTSQEVRQSGISS